MSTTIRACISIDEVTQKNFNYAVITVEGECVFYTLIALSVSLVRMHKNRFVSVYPSKSVPDHIMS